MPEKNTGWGPIPDGLVGYCVESVHITPAEETAHVGRFQNTAVDMDYQVLWRPKDEDAPLVLDPEKLWKQAGVLDGRRI